MNSISLCGKWSLRGRKQGCEDKILELTAEVPGCVQLDLSREGYLPEDLYFGMNITRTEDFEDYEWWYEREFECEAKERSFLVFEGVDCIAEYYLNGEKFGESDNMMIAHEFDVSAYLCKGKNTLTVHLRSAVLEERRYDYPMKLLFGRHLEGRFIRKPPHSYGWDIMPRAVTAGLWREVRLEERDPIYFTQCFVDTGSGRCSLRYTVDMRAEVREYEIEILGSCGESRFYKRQRCAYSAGCFDFKIDSPRLWYPYGYGEANVYDGEARIYAEGELVHKRALSFGIRDVVLERCDPDGDKPARFRFLINGTEVMCKGSNWVPMDAFHSRDAQRYAEALSLAKDIGCNILRCWGGNVYEDHAFFDFCDRNGIMVWQDFSMACSLYPETEDFKKRLAEEAVSVIRRYRSHPSIILWSGDNEIDACFTHVNPDNNSLTREVLPKCVEQNDMGRPYLASSPYITGRMFEQGYRSQGYDMPFAEDHLWGPRDYFKSDFYRTNRAVFVSEAGYHGCPSLRSIEKFISPGKVFPYQNNDEWILHSADQCGDDSRVMLMEKQVRQLFGEVPTEPEDYILASQISQAEAKKYFIERMRVDRPQRCGIIWWNLIDGWPQMSDAVVDYYYTKKLAYYYIKRSQAPFIIAADEISDWGLPICACNDTPSEVRGSITVTDAQSDELLYEGEFTASANTTTPITKLTLYYSERRMLIFRWKTDAGEGFNHYTAGNPPFSLESYKALIEKHGLGK